MYRYFITSTTEIKFSRHITPGDRISQQDVDLLTLKREQVRKSLKNDKNMLGIISVSVFVMFLYL